MKQLFLKTFMTIVIVALFSGLVSIINYKDPEKINYRNSDATWHALLTIKAYSQTPSSIHHFLPIVTLGNKLDKGISWGATIPDKKGNYYYTSFSPAGYVLPYAFIKVFNLNVDEDSLYLFNSILLMISTVLLSLFVLEIFSKSKYRYLLAVFAAMIYATTPEVMHGMGRVYWHQSIMQVTLLLQIYAFYKFHESRWAKCGFYVLAFINPYIEWTGYVANVGFIFAEFLRQDKKINKDFLKLSVLIIVLTALSGLAFVAHYLSVLSIDDFFATCLLRASARSGNVLTDLFVLIQTYFVSFRFSLILLFALWFYLNGQNVKIKEKSLLLINKPLLVVLLFPIFENILMLNHAINYTYDAMKLSFFIMFVLADLLNILLPEIKTYAKQKKLVMIAVLIFVIVANISVYNNDKFYVSNKFNNKIQNLEIADYIKNTYAQDETIIVASARIRGYLTLLFDKNIYESVPFERLFSNKKFTNCKTLVYLWLGRIDNHEVEKIESALIYDLGNNRYSLIKYQYDKLIKFHM